MGGRAHFPVYFSKSDTHISNGQILHLTQPGNTTCYLWQITSSNLSEATEGKIQRESLNIHLRNKKKDFGCPQTLVDYFRHRGPSLKQFYSIEERKEEWPGTDNQLKHCASSESKFEKSLYLSHLRRRF